MRMQGRVAAEKKAVENFFADKDFDCRIKNLEKPLRCCKDFSEKRDDFG